MLDHALENRQVRAEIAWVRRHPEFLARIGPRMERHLPALCEAVHARGLPGEICLLPVIESALNPRARSRKGAVGLWQFIPGTARRYDLKIDWWADERRDPVAATDAALRYLTDLHALFDDWLLALAGYNCGERAVARALNAAPEGASFFDIRLPRETRRYVPRLLAFAAIFADPDAHGIALPGRVGRNEALASSYAAVPLPGQTDLSRVAEATGLSLERIQQLNPALNRWATHPDGPHRLLLPASRADTLLPALAALPVRAQRPWIRHRIAARETLGHIALRYGVDVPTLMRANGLGRTLIRAGDTLLVPRRDGAAAAFPDGTGMGTSDEYVVQAGDSLWAISRRVGVPLERLMRDNAVAPGELLRIGRRLTLPFASAGGTSPGSASPGMGANGPPRAGTAQSSGSAEASSRAMEVRYRIRRGDTLDRIARAFDVSVRDLVAWNALDPKSYIFPGQELVLRLDGSG